MSNEWDHARLPVNYNAAVKALAQCASVDECLEWKRVAQAMASYARQMNDTSMLDRANDIRNRARRRFGQLANDKAPAKPGPKITGAITPLINGRQAMAKEVGVSDSERQRAQRIANMPEAEFERRSKDPGLGLPVRKQVDLDYWIKAVNQIATLPVGGLKVRDPADTEALLLLAERALKNLTAWAIMLKKAKKVGR